MPLNRKKWGIKEAIPKTEKADLTLDESKMVEIKSPCCVCGAEMVLQAHEAFVEVYDGTLGIKTPHRANSGPVNSILDAVNHFKKHTACDWCATARRDFDASKEAIGKVVAWLGRNYDGPKKGWRVDTDQQQRMGQILHSWTKKWSDALRRMHNAQNLVWSLDMGRIIWTRPKAAFTFMAKMEDFLYDPGMPEKQQKQQISNILKWMRGQEQEIV